MSRSISIQLSRKTTSEWREAFACSHSQLDYLCSAGFPAQLDALEQQVETLKQKDPIGYVKKNATKRLAAITKLAFDVIPQDPTRPEYRQGGTLGEDRKHWFRAKFFQQYRLFFRHHAQAKVIVYAWVNDERTKRAYVRCR